MDSLVIENSGYVLCRSPLIKVVILFQINVKLMWESLPFQMVMLPIIVVNNSCFHFSRAVVRSKINVISMFKSQSSAAVIG